MWLNFYRNMANNKFNPYKYRKQKQSQIGRDLYGRFKGSYMVTVNPNPLDSESTPIKSTLVTPVAAAEVRAVSELTEEKQNKKPHVKILKTGIKRRKSPKMYHKEKIRQRIILIEN